MQNGKIGVTTENIFPIIKNFSIPIMKFFCASWFSNGTGTTQKLKALSHRWANSKGNWAI